MTSYTTIIKPDEKKQVRKLVTLYVASLGLAPIQCILMGIAIWKGFMHSDNSFLYIALPAVFIILLIQFFTFGKLNRSMDRSLAVINPLMWERLTGNVEKKYGAWGSISPLDNPEEIAPPDGTSSNKSGKVLWQWKDSDKSAEVVKLTVDKETGEPFIVELEELLEQNRKARLQEPFDERKAHLQDIATHLSNYKSDRSSAS